MTDTPSHDAAATVTRLLNEAADGDARAAASLLPLVYDQLRALARHRMRNERPDQTLQATALVHEAYLRLVDAPQAQTWDGRWHFFAASAAGGSSAAATSPHPPRCRRADRRQPAND
jgi:hypothetical protein